MKKYYLFFIMVGMIHSAKAGYIQHLINQTSSDRFVAKDVFSLKPVNKESDERLRPFVSLYDLMNVDAQQLSQVANSRPDALEIPILMVGVWETLQLIKSNTIDENTLYTIQRGNGPEPISYKPGAYYYGVIKNKTNTIAAVSFFENDVIGMIGTDHGNYVLGRGNIHDMKSQEFIVYNDKNYLLPNDMQCKSGDNYLLNPIQQEGNQVMVETITTKCVKVYIECDYKFFQDHSNDVTISTNFATGLFNLTKTLYLNDSISTGISQIVVWSVSDPYVSSATSSAMLTAFGNALSSGFNGDLAHLFSNRAIGGGIAWINSLCDMPQYRTAVSASLNNSMTSIPTYSWNANVITHEMGHNVGSSHTHSCVWNGNNTRIDNCGGHAGYTSGTCADVLPDPAGGGTIMSYCHLVSGIGINFNLGFGPLPGTLLRSKVNNASCLTPCTNCASNLNISGVYITPVTQSGTWIKSMTQTTIPDTTTVKLDADPINGYILIQPDPASSFFAKPDSSHFFVAQANDGCGSNLPARLASTPSASMMNPSQSAFILYPNPAFDQLTIQNKNTADEFISYEILTIEGRVLQSQKNMYFSHQVDIHISNLNPGLYFIKIHGMNETSMIKFRKY